MKRWLILLTVLLAGLAQIASAGELLLTGLMSSPLGTRAWFHEMPSGVAFSLEPGREVDGLKLLHVDAVSGCALVLRGSQTEVIAFPGSVSNRSDYAQYLVTGDLPPSFTGVWPEGYVPKIIRDHRAGLLPRTTRLATNGGGEGASQQYIAALEAYAEQLPSAERIPILNELMRYNAPSSFNGYDSSQGPLVPVDSNRLFGEADFKNLGAADAQLLRSVLAAPLPGIGTLTDRGELGRIQDILFHQTSPRVEQRLWRYLDGYAAPSSFNGHRTW